LYDKSNYNLEEKKMKIEISLEKTFRISREFEITPEQLERLYSDNQLIEEMKKDVENGSVSFDYCVCEADGNTLIDWRN
jgi:hypothetical protein